MAAVVMVMLLVGSAGLNVPTTTAATTRRSFILTTGAAAAVVVVPPVGAAPTQQKTMEAEAIGLFEQGKYDAALRCWTELTMKYPTEGSYWSNRGTLELIVGSRDLTLGKAPEGRAETTLLGAVTSFEKAEDLGDADAIALNNRGNVYNALLKWSEAATLYDRAIGAASKTPYASIPRENRALVAFQLNDLDDALKRTDIIVRRDPNFLDAKALLAAIHYARGETEKAETTFAGLCRPTVTAPNQFKTPIPGLGGPDFCDLYSSTDYVKDRWTPRAVDAYDAFLRSRNKNARIASDIRPFDR